MYIIDFEESYLKSSKKFLRKNPHFSKTYIRTLGKLEEDPFNPSLKLHKLKGKLKDFYAISLNHEYRIILILQIIEERIILVDIGTHDEVYRA